jgi:hypothetical protein
VITGPGALIILHRTRSSTRPATHITNLEQAINGTGMIAGLLTTSPFPPIKYHRATGVNNQQLYLW